MTEECTKRIEMDRVKIFVPHEKTNIAFAYPSEAPDDYAKVGKSILEQGFKVPLGDYTASLVHPAYCSKNNNKPEFRNVRNVMRNIWIWIFNINLWTNNGVYVLQDTEAIGRSQELDSNELEKMLKGGREIKGIRFSEDKKLRFAPKGSYTLDFQTSESFAKDGFIIASFGQKGAEKLGEVSTKFKGQPYIYGLKIGEGQNPEQRVSALGGGDAGISFYGDSLGDDYGDCSAWRVLETNSITL